MTGPFPVEYYETQFRLVGSPEPLPRAFAIITAWNPMDCVYSSKMNRAADHRLRRLLERRCSHHFPAIGESPDGSHAEDGWAVVVSLSDALAIGRRYKQRAIWWIEDDQLHLISCSTNQMEALGPFSERIR